MLVIFHFSVAARTSTCRLQEIMQHFRVTTRARTDFKENGYFTGAFHFPFLEKLQRKVLSSVLHSPMGDIAHKMIMEYKCVLNVKALDTVHHKLHIRNF